jgi:MFS family permease
MSALLKTEKRAMLSLALVYAMRMVGLFMILPVFSLYAQDYAGATPLLVGLAIGVYGLTQGLFQLPFGFLSDRFGRKRMIVIGLVLFALGSVLAALAQSIEMVIAGRALQGMGAIAAVVMALAADLTREEIRLRIMAVIGMTIGVAFMASMVLGPVLAASVGISGIFWITAVLALASIVIVLTVTPTPLKQGFHRDAQLSLSDLGRVISNRELLRLDFGVFVLHMVLAATFVIFPLILRDDYHLAVGEHWKTYLPVFLLSILVMLPMIVTAERKRRMRLMFISGVALVALAELGLAWADEYTLVFAMLVLFFGGFNFLEASMPSLVAKIAPADMKGSAMGLFSAAQFLGAFSGGVLGGVMLASGSLSSALMQLGLIVLAWFLVALGMKNPRPLTSRIVSLQGLDEEALARFQARALDLPGVQEVSVYIEDRIAYLKIDRKAFDDTSLDDLVTS